MPYEIAVDAQGMVAISQRIQGAHLVRVSILAGSACDDNASTITCAPGTFISWEDQTCLPCPSGASASGFAFSSHCVNEDGSMYEPLSALAAAASPAGAIIGGLLATVAFLATLAFAAKRRLETRAQMLSAPTLAAAYEAQQGFEAIVTPLGALSASGRDDLPLPPSATRSSRGASAAPVSASAPMPQADTVAIPWSHLEPDLGFVPLFGSFGVIFRATWRGTKRVAVKVPRAAVVHGLMPQQAREMLVKEARGLVLAQNRGANDFVVQLHGVAQGTVTSSGWDALLARAKQLAVVAEMEGSGGGGGGGGAGVGGSTSSPHTSSGGDSGGNGGSGSSGTGSGGRSLPPLLPSSLPPSSRPLVALIMSFEDGGSLADALYPRSMSAPWPSTQADRLRVCKEVRALREGPCLCAAGREESRPRCAMPQRCDCARAARLLTRRLTFSHPHAHFAPSWQNAALQPTHRSWPRACGIFMTWA